MPSAILGAAQMVTLDEEARARDERVRAAVHAHHDLVWRSLRRLGVPEHAADDATQHVFLVFTRRIDTVAVGKEKTFLLGVVIHVAQETRRQRGVRIELAEDHALAAFPAQEAGPDERLDAQRARVLLDAILAAMPIELRTVLVLYEIEEMTMADIAATLEVPAGTVASRLRRARELFGQLAQQAQRAGARGAR